MCDCFGIYINKKNERKKEMKKRIISLLLALILALSLLPVQTVVAEDEGSAAKSVVKNMQISCISARWTSSWAMRTRRACMPGTASGKSHLR